MCKRLILFYFLILIFIYPLFSTYVNLESKNLYNSVDLKINNEDYKIDVTFKDNKLERINNFQFKTNNLIIKKENVFLNKELNLDIENNYFLFLKFPKFKMGRNFSPLIKSNLDLAYFSFNLKYLTYESVVYFFESEKVNDFFYDYSSLNYTNQGVINYLELNLEKLIINQEIALSSFGLIYSVKGNYKLNKLDLYALIKNNNERYIYGCKLNYYPVNIELQEKIFPLSIYSGQGKRREFYIKSNIKYNNKLNNYNTETNIKLYHNIKYDKYLERTIKNYYSFTKKLFINKNEIALQISKGAAVSLSLSINNIIIKYKKDILSFEINYETKNKNTKYKLKFSTNKELNFSYTFSF